jgi:hypothetical protein
VSALRTQEGPSGRRDLTMPALSLRPPVVGELRLAVPVVLLVITMLAIFFQRRSAVAAYLAAYNLLT